MRLQVKWIGGWAYVHGTGPDGRRIRRALKTRDARQAEEARSQLEARLWKQGIYGADAVVTFDEAALAYAQDGGEARYLLRIAKELAGMKLRDITPNVVRAAAKRAYPGTVAATVNRQGIVPAQAVINYGHAQGWCAPIRVKGFPVKKPKRVAVDREYLDALRPHMPINLYALMLFLHQTGRRVGDAIGLTPADVNLVRAVVTIDRTKNGDGAICHLTPELCDLLRQIEPRGGRVFGYAGNSSLYPTLRRACRKAGVPYLGTHQPGRHSFATTLRREGWSPKEVADAGGWKTVRMVSETYEHPDAPTAKAAAVFGKHLAKPKEKPQE